MAVLVDGDQLAFRWRVTGTHSGDFMGDLGQREPHRPLGNDVGVMREGKLVERGYEQDMLSLLTQIRAIDVATSPT